MTTNTKLEMRVLEAHELNSVSGGGIPAQQQALRHDAWWGGTAGMTQIDFAVWKTWADQIEPVSSPVQLANWVSHVGRIS